MKKLILYGASSFTKSVSSLVSQTRDYEVVFICIDDEYITPDLKEFCNVPVISLTRAILDYSHYEYFICIGYSNMRNREVCYNKLKNSNLSIATIVSAKAAINNCNIGEGVIIFDGVVIEQGCEIEPNVTVWSNSTICHDSKIAAHCFIAANSTIGGYCNVGGLSFVGFSTTIVDHVSVGKECLIGAGCLVLKDTEAYSQYIGSPAYKVKAVHDGLGVMV
jgi:UDP-N-acetylbacillosamine N-acetyltransferase